MSLIVIGAIAAAASLTGVIAARAMVRRRKRAAEANPSAADQEAQPALLGMAEPASVPAADLPVTRGDVIQVGEDSRWPRGSIEVSQEGGLHCAILWSRDGGEDHATVSFPRPERDILWLDPVELALPPTPPTRIEIDGHLLDRSTLFPAVLEARGKVPIQTASDGMFAQYDGAVGDAAVVLIVDGQTMAFYGRRVAPEDFDNLGQVDPTNDEIGGR